MLGTSHGVASIAAAIAPNGRAYVVWAEQDGGEEAGRALTVNATIAAPSNFRFHDARQLAVSPAAARPQGTPRVVVDDAGNATAAWSLPADDGTATRRGGLRRRRALVRRSANVAAGGILQDLAGTPGGAALVLWTGNFGETFSPRAVAAAYRAPGAAAFGAAERVAPDPEDPGDAAAAFDAAGRPLVAWTGRPGYRGEFPPTEPRAVRVSQRE